MSEERFYPCNRKLAERLGISFIALKRWIYQGKIRAVKTVGRRYRIPENEILRIMGKEPRPTNGVVVYARVSSHDQVKDGDLDRQFEHLKGYVASRDYQAVEQIKEIGSGLNDRRPKLPRMLRMAAEKKVDVIIVEYKDRLMRFGFNYLMEFARSHGARVETVFDNVKKKDATQEMVEDMISVIRSFSTRLLKAVAQVPNGCWRD